MIIAGAGGRKSLSATLVRGLAFRATEGPAAVLALGIGAAAGHMAAARYSAGGVEPLNAVSVVGPGMPRIGLEAELETTSGQRDGRQGSDQHVAGFPSPLALWSRTIGALGEPAWRRLTELHVAIVGCGRTGSLVATGLNHMGVKRLALIDPDLAWIFA